MSARRSPGSSGALVPLLGLVMALGSPGCNRSPEGKAHTEPQGPASGEPGARSPSPSTARNTADSTARKSAARHAGKRSYMVENHIAARGIDDAKVLAAMGSVLRHEFVPEDLRWRAYDDTPLPIGEDQTISQPYIVALMTELAGVDESSRVLEIGTGSGYQAAVLAEIAREVYTIEIIEPLGVRARKDLERLGYDNIHYRIGDGYRGWPEAAPFDAIVVTAAPPHVPGPLKEQLAEGASLIIPVGERFQSLRVITRTGTGYDDREVAAVRFVPMTGEAQE